MKNLLIKIFSIFSVFTLLFDALGYFSLEENEAELNWEENIITVTEAGPGSYVSYPRMYTLSDGTLICGYERNCDMYCKKSFDNGLTWKESETLISHFDGLICANAAFIQRESGELLCAYRATGHKDGKFYGSLRVSSSNDNGETWSFHSTIIETLQDSDNFNGVWEPHFGFIGEKLAVFYSNDSLNDAVLTGSQQNIEFKLWDGNSWGEKHIASAGSETDSRDGMPVWCQLSNGEYVMTIESTHLRDSAFTKRNFVIQLLTSNDGINWSRGKDIYISPNKKTSVYAGAPYIVELPDGRLCVSFQTDEDVTVEANDAWTARVITTRKPYDGNCSRFSFTKPFAPFGKDGVSNWNGMLVHEDYLLVFTTKRDETGNKILLRRATL